jgi:hypothetical protein
MDFHVHVGPEFLARRYDAFRIAEEAERDGFGCVLKNHFMATTAVAAQARLHRPVTVLGSVVLNYSVGGLNPEAIRAAQSANKGWSMNRKPDDLPFVVWMPTIHAESHLNYNRRHDLVPAWGVEEKYCRFFPPGTGITLWGPAGEGTEINPVVYDILDLIKTYDLILATGHLSGPEVKVLVAVAHEKGLRRIIVTHPFYGAINLSIREQAELAEREGVYIEHCQSNMEIDRIPIQHYVASIREVSPGHVILTSDAGQPHIPPVGEALWDFIRQFKALGVDDDDLGIMLVENPHRLTGTIA